LGTLDAAHAKPLCVKRDAKVREAVTLMIQHDFSQLPVMQNSRDVDGLISWKSIAEASKVHNKECTFVRECMDIDVEILKHDARRRGSTARVCFRVRRVSEVEA